MRLIYLCYALRPHRPCKSSMPSSSMHCHDSCKSTWRCHACSSPFPQRQSTFNMQWQKCADSRYAAGVSGLSSNLCGRDRACQHACGRKQPCLELWTTGKLLEGRRGAIQTQATQPVPTIAYGRTCRTSPSTPANKQPTQKHI